MSDEMREKVATVVTQNVYSGDFDRLTDAILALIASELERVERERDEALRMWPDRKLPSEYTCLTGNGWVLAGDRKSIDRVIRQDHEARACWPATVERLKAAEARATAAEARLADLGWERDEALALTECCTSLKDMAACVIQGAHAEARLAEAVEEIVGLVAEVADNLNDLPDHYTIELVPSGYKYPRFEIRVEDFRRARTFMEQQG